MQSVIENANENSTSTEVLAAARGDFSSTGKGWSLFPIKSGTKGTVLVSSWKQESTSDINQINAWSTEHKGDLNWGCDNGKSGLLGLDSDTPEGEAELEAMNLPSTFTVKSGNPDPWRKHRYLELPPGVQIKSDSSKKKFAFDIKSSGGMFVFPPSIHPESGKPYRILDGRKAAMAPDHLIEKLKEAGLIVDPNAPKPAPVVPEDIIPATLDQQNHTRYIVQKMCDNFAALPEDSPGHDQLLRIGKTFGGYIITGCIDLESAQNMVLAACAVWYTARRTEREVKRVFMDGVREGLKYPLYPGQDANDIPWQSARRTPEEEARRRKQIEENVLIGEGVNIEECPVAEEISLEYMEQNFVKIMNGKRVVDINRPRRIYSYDEWKSDLKGSVTFKKVKGDPYFDHETGGMKSKAYDTLDLWNALKGRRRTVDTVTFRPGAKQITHDPEGLLAVNIWVPFDRSKVTPGDPALFINHVRYLFGEEAEHLFDWLAHIEQHPGDLPHCGWVHVSPGYGTGRNAMASILCRVWEGYTSPNFDLVETLRTGYNDALSRKILVIVDEINEGASKDKWANSEKLKSIVTTDRRLINPKYGRQRTEFNCARWLMFSNHSTALPLTEGDRRFWVVRNDRPKKSDEYYSALYAALRDPRFIAGVAQFLAQRDIRSFNPGEHPKMTAAKREMVGTSKTDVDDKIEELIATHPRDVITNNELARILSDQPGQFGAKLSGHHLNALERTGVRLHKNPIWVEGKAVKVRILRDFHYWIDRSNEEIKSELNRQTAAEGNSFAKFVAKLYAEEDPQVQLQSPEEDEY
jgi:Bifunctional DNA primase/polymerase, N-terminal/Family of unknown function (DUF5906)